MMQIQKLGDNKFKDLIQFWPNSRTFKALKMKQIFSRVFKDVGTLFKVIYISCIVEEASYNIFFR